MRRLSQKVQLSIKDTSLRNAVERQTVIFVINFSVFYPKTLARSEILKHTLKVSLDNQ